jgi:ankyrin repeat protein
MRLAMAGHRKVVSLLIDHKANINCVNLFGETPQKLAKLEHHFSLKFLPSSLLPEKENGPDSSGGSSKRTEHFSFF